MQIFAQSYSDCRNEWQRRRDLVRELGAHSNRKMADLGFSQNDLPAWVTGRLVGNHALSQQRPGPGR